MRKYKKIFGLIVVILIQTSLLFPNIIQELIKDKEWSVIGSYFSDSSYLKLKTKFCDYQKIHLDNLKEGKIKYFIKYNDKSEIGFIEFKKEKDKFTKLKIKINFADLTFVNGFRKFPIKHKLVQIGDAELTFKDGFFYVADPIRRLVFFSGNLSIKITPKDLEEQKTLQYLYKASAFLTTTKKGIFVFKSVFMDEFLKKNRDIKLEISDQDRKFINEQLTYVQKEYGIKINEFNEYWYSSFSEALNLMVFKKKSSYYKYVYSRNNVPDTFLVDQRYGKHILNYNKIKGMKFGSFRTNRVKKIQLYIRLNPQKKKMWSNALLIFPEATNFKSFEISKDLEIHDFFIENDNDLDYIRYEDKLHISGNNFDELSFYYSGKLSDNRKKLEMMKYKVNKSFGKIDDFLFFDNVNKFYPNPGNQFFESTLKISVPKDINLLASGFLKSKKLKHDRNELIFKSDGTKGLTMVCGRFNQIDKIDSNIPLRVYGAERVKIKKYFKNMDLKDSFNFLYKLYGRRKIKEVNLLIRRWINYGGISYKGFIVFNVVKKSLSEDRSVKRSSYSSNPVYLTNNINRDNLVHELSHQWWGGIISWKTYKDVWITEGGAQFSTLLYLESILSKRKFERIIKKILKRVKRDAEVGPIIYGNRIQNVSGDYYAYQSLIYNKSALVFFMLRDIIGEKKLFKKINKIFSKYKKKSISTNKFISEITDKEKGEKELVAFFKKWIFSREIPLLEYKININKKTATIDFEQKNTDFVFPVRVIIETNAKTEREIVIIKNMKQKFVIEKNTIIKNIKVYKGFSPINLRKNNGI